MRQGLRNTRAGARWCALLLCIAAADVAGTGQVFAPARDRSAAAGIELPQTPRFRRLGVAEGLPSSTVFQLAQDRAGYLWIASGDGLARFDGIGFRLFRHDPRDAASLPGNVVQALHVGADDRVFVASEGAGLAVLDRQRRRFTRLPLLPAGEGAADIWAIAADGPAQLWLGGFGGGLRRIDAVTGALLRQWRHDPDAVDTLSSDIVLALAPDGAGGVWAATARGVDHVGSQGVQRLRGLPAGVVVSLHLDRDGALWIGTSAGLFVRRTDGRLEAAVPDAALAGRGATAVHRDGQGNLWIGTRRGLLRQHGRRIEDLSAAFAAHPGALPGTVLGIFEDHEHGLWFATRGAGLARLAPTWRNFAVVPARADASIAAALQAAGEDSDGQLWLVGDAGLLRIAPGSGDPEWVFGGEAFAGRRQWSVLADGQAVWVGQQAGLTRFDRDTGTLRHFAAGSGRDAAPDGAVDLLVSDGAGGLWLSGYGVGLQRRDHSGRVLLEIRPGDGRGLEHADSEQLAIDGNGALWLAGAQGLLQWIEERGAFERPAGAPAERVHAFAFAPGGSIWVQTTGRLRAYAPRGAMLELTHEAGMDDGLPALAAGGLAVDAAGDVWMSSARGLVRYRPGTGALRSYGVRDGLPSPEFSDRPLAATRGGHIAAATAAGMVLFDPQALEDLGGTPRLVLEQVSLRRGNQRVQLQAPLPPLAHDDRELEVVTRLLSFADPAGHRYRTRLLGIDEHWIEHGADGTRRIGQLPPGNYQLQAVAANADGLWAARPLRLDIAVAPPWWRTPLALAGWMLLGLGTLVAAAVLYRLRLRRAHARELAERQRQWAVRASEAKSAFLATMGHEVRTPMTGVLGMTELLLDSALDARQRRYAEGIRQSGELMLRVVNDALDMARIEAGRLELSPAPLAPQVLLEGVAAQCRALAEHKRLALETSVAAGTPPWVQGDALRLTQILLNLVGNAIKFTEAGTVRIEARAGTAPHTLELVVADSGPGMDADAQSRLFQRFRQGSAEVAQRHGGSGLGLAICGELAAAMDGEVRLVSAPGAGTRVHVLLPLPLCAAPAPEHACSQAGTAARQDCESTRALRVLLVEDDAAVAEVLSALLARGGHHVVCAAHALAALAAQQHSSFDAALIDLDLPGGPGVQLAAMLRQAGARFPMLAITARADAAAEADAAAAGLAPFLRKPIAGPALLRAIEAAVRDGATARAAPAAAPASC